MRISDWSSDVCSSDLLHLILFIPRIKLVEGVEHGLANFDEGRAETHRAPISKGPNRNTAPVAFSHLVRRKEFAIWHYRLLRQHDQGRVDRKSTRLNSSH